MRILLTTDYYWPCKGGGVEVVVKQLAERLARNNHTVMVLTLNVKNAPRHEWLNGVEVVRIPATEITPIVRMQLAIPLTPWEIPLAIRRFKPDIIHMHNRFYTTSAVVSLVKGKIPSVFTLHLGPVSMGKLVRIYEKVISNHILKASDCITAVSDWASQVWPDCSVIKNGVDTDLYHPVSPPVTRNSVLCVGRLIQNKGPHRLIEAVPFVDRNLNIVFVGNGPMRKELEKRVTDLGVDSRVQFLGETPEVFSHLSRGLALVRASDTEGMSLCVLEALSCGIPVIASPVAAGEMVQDGINGYVIEKDNPQEMASAVNSLYLDNQLWLKMAKAARATAEKYSWDNSVEQYELVYKKYSRTRGASY
jgi:glycosyltransferase involved in cell wall biosynthesis